MDLTSHGKLDQGQVRFLVRTWVGGEMVRVEDLLLAVTGGDLAAEVRSIERPEGQRFAVRAADGGLELSHRDDRGRALLWELRPDRRGGYAERFTVTGRDGGSEVHVEAVHHPAAEASA